MLDVVSSSPLKKKNARNGRATSSAGETAAHERRRPRTQTRRHSRNRRTDKGQTGTHARNPGLRPLHSNVLFHKHSRVLSFVTITVPKLSAPLAAPYTCTAKQSAINQFAHREPRRGNGLPRGLTTAFTAVPVTSTSPTCHVHQAAKDWDFLNVFSSSVARSLRAASSSNLRFASKAWRPKRRLMRVQKMMLARPKEAR